MDFSPDKLKARFEELSAKRAAVDKKLDPARAELNELAAGDTKLSHGDAIKREAKLRADIVKLQAELAPIENERAAVARALGGQTGVPKAFK